MLYIKKRGFTGGCSILQKGDEVGPSQVLCVCVCVQISVSMGFSSSSNGTQSCVLFRRTLLDSILF